MQLSRAEIVKIAKAELEAESLRAAVDAEKERLRAYRSPWERIFPWKITITRRSA